MTYETSVPPISIDISLAHELHLRRQLSLKNADHLGHPGLAVDVRKHGGPAQTNRTYPKRQQCQDMRGSPDATVGIDLYLAEDFWVVLVDIEQDLDGRGSEVDDAAAVVGDVDGLEAEVGNTTTTVNILDWLGRTALELIGQSGFGYSFDNMEDDVPKHKYSIIIKDLV